jgi:SAM-dependent methyltransferase
MDNTARFTGKADVYAKARPGYAAELIERLSAWAELDASATVADIGAGTGIFSAQLAETGTHVIAVEPNDEMRAQAELRFDNSETVSVVAGTAEATGIAAGSIDLVTAAQAFHWFDCEAFRTECLRILRGDARVALVWNMRVSDAPVNASCERTFYELCPRFKGFSGGVRMDDPTIAQFFHGKFDQWHFKNDLVYNREAFVARCLSGSYAPKEGESSYETFVSAVNDIFDEYQQDGRLIVPNRTNAYVGALR